MKLSELFKNCAYNVEYKTIGNDVNYAFVEEGDALYIYFQGSSSVTDWVRNFMFRSKPYKDMRVPYKVHRGFLAAWKEVEDLVIDKVREERYGAFKYNRITVVGYSHGGALATFCHECVWFHRPDLREKGLEGYGFEAPRIYSGWKVKDSLRERWANFTIVRTNNDIVTHCPPFLFAYRHVAKVLRVKGDVGLCPNKKVPNCVKSHYPEVVLDALSKIGE